METTWRRNGHKMDTKWRQNLYKNGHNEVDTNGDQHGYQNGEKISTLPHKSR